ncbi:hypothetical protein Peur_036665 [Populus x canadensis]
MVLAQLGGSISRAIQQMSNATIIDEKALNDCLNEITRALLQSDVQFKLLKQNATRAKIPFYGSYMESDPVKIAVEVVERFKKENCDLIIVDTSGQHKQEAALFEEIRQVSEATKPELVIFVTDSSVGQIAFDQAQAFKQSVAVGAVIVTKMDGHAKGGGTLSAVAATKNPVIFYWYSRLCFDVVLTSEIYVDVFDSHSVCIVMIFQLGVGDWSGFMDKIQENLLKMGAIGQVFSMLPGFSAELMPKGHEKESQVKIKRYMTKKDSMTNDELDSLNPKLMNESRMMRIARGAGRPIRDVMEMLEEYTSDLLRSGAK